MSERKTSDSQIRELVETGSDIAGGAVGGALGYLITGPAGAVVGSASGPAAAVALRYLASEFKQRVLGPREEVRVGAVIAFAGDKIRQNVQQGQRVRQDEFFEEELGERSTADEVFEGVLLAAQREPQEKKIRFYGNLVANIAFHPEIDRDQATFLISLGESLSYRQLCLLRLFAVNNKFRLREKDYREGGLSGAKRIALVQEIYSLTGRGLLSAGGEAVLGVTDIIPGKMSVQGVAATLHSLMELQEISSQDLNRTAHWLR
jgi:hypothetical protein